MRGSIEAVRSRGRVLVAVLLATASPAASFHPPFNHAVAPLRLVPVPPPILMCAQPAVDNEDASPAPAPSPPAIDAEMSPKDYLVFVGYIASFVAFFYLAAAVIGQFPQ